MRWIAALACRSPPRLSRCRSVRLELVGNVLIPTRCANLRPALLEVFAQVACVRGQRVDAFVQMPAPGTSAMLTDRLATSQARGASWLPQRSQPRPSSSSAANHSRSSPLRDLWWATLAYVRASEHCSAGAHLMGGETCG